MSNVEFTLTSNADLVKAATDEAIQTALETVGVQAQGYATANITANGSVRTGELRASIQFEVQDHELTIGSALSYAPFVEYGTGIHAESGGGRQTPWVYYNELEGKFFTTTGMKPAPFLRPAIEDHLDEYQQIFEQILQQLSSE